MQERSVCYAHAFSRAWDVNSVERAQTVNWVRRSTRALIVILQLVGDLALYNQVRKIFKSLTAEILQTSCISFNRCSNMPLRSKATHGLSFFYLITVTFFTVEAFFRIGWISSLNVIASEMFRRQKISSNVAKEFCQTQGNASDAGMSRGSTSPNPSSVAYKDQKSMPERKQEVATIRSKFPNKIPVN